MGLDAQSEPQGSVFLYAGSCETDDGAEKRHDYQHCFGGWDRWGMTYSPPYAASKAAIINLTKVAAANLAEHGVTVNAVAPGIVETAFNWTLDDLIGVQQMGLSPGEFMERRRDSIPLGRLQQPQDIANVVAFLAGPDASEMTGETVVVSGGLVTR